MKKPSPVGLSLSCFLLSTVVDVALENRMKKIIVNTGKQRRIYGMSCVSIMPTSNNTTRTLFLSCRISSPDRAKKELLKKLSVNKPCQRSMSLI